MRLLTHQAPLRLPTHFPFECMDHLCTLQAVDRTGHSYLPHFDHHEVGITNISPKDCL